MLIMILIESIRLINHSLGNLSQVYLIRDLHNWDIILLGMFSQYKFIWRILFHIVQSHRQGINSQSCYIIGFNFSVSN